MRSKQADQKSCHDAHSRDRSFDIGQSVLVRNLRDGPKWIPGIVIEQTGPVSYKVQVNDQIWHRHTDQLLDHNVVVEPCPEDVKERDIPEIRIPPPVALPESTTVKETEILKLKVWSLKWRTLMYKQRQVYLGVIVGENTNLVSQVIN